MSEEYINKINLEYLLNPNKLKKNNKILIDDKIEKDIKFYRKRINQLTKDMLKGNYPNDNIKILFESYVLQIIYYFKQQDTKDIYQEEYSDLNLDNCKDNNVIFKNNINDIEKIDNLLINNKTSSIPNLESFVKRKNVNQMSTDLIPQKKCINIRDPQYRMKGVKSINNKE